MKAASEREKLNRAVAAALVELRKSAGLSQEQLAFECDLHPTYISKLERGLKTPTLLTLFTIADALEQRPQDIVAKIESIR